ncbi:nickel-dependent lactate racemase [Chloroflexota bacterium]
MRIKVPYGKDEIEVAIDEANVAGIVEANDVPVTDESETIRKAIEKPINAKSFHDFLSDAKDVLFIVNDATRPTPTARVLEILFALIKPFDMSKIKFIIATGAHRAPTDEEYWQIFGEYYEEFRSRIYAHDARAKKDMVFIGKSRNGTEMYVNKLGMEAHKIVIISSVEPHYTAGYTGGRKSFLPGIAAYKTIEQNHGFIMSPKSKTLVLEGNPMHEDMVDALGIIRDKEIFTINTVLDRNHRVYATTAGHIVDSFLAATVKAKEVFAVKIKEKADIVVSVAGFPMDIDLYQSQKALENGKLALREGGVLILVSKCRCGIGDETFTRLLCACNTPEEAFKKINEGYVLGYHKAAKIAEISTWAEMYGVTELPDELLRSIFFTPFSSLQEALDHALSKKGGNAKVLFLLDGTMTVPILDQ